MDFNKGLTNLVGTHSFLSPSSPAWINYSEDKLDRVFFTAMAAKRGTELHAFAAQAIKLGIRLPDTSKTLNCFVNDAIGFRMTPEQLVFYSVNCYGHADALGFNNHILRVHDLKTGVNEVSPTQLEIYAALFCLEYRFKPNEITTELRIYQNDEVKIFEADPDSIFHIMDRIVSCDKRIESLKAEIA
jgi:hypothetical protein